MGKLSAGKDVLHYVPLTGREPELKAPGPVWVVQIRGDIPQRYSQVWTDPSCIVTTDYSGYFATGPVRNTFTGKITAPEPPINPPDWSLPPLAP